MSEPEDEIEITEEQAASLVERVSASIIEKVIESGAMIPPEIIRRAMGEALTDNDQEGLALMTGAFFEGREDAHREMLLHGMPEATDPSWEDVDGGGLRKSMHREMMICGRCEHAAVCIVSRTIPAELLIVVSRCLAFTPRSG